MEREQLNTVTGDSQVDRGSCLMLRYASQNSLDESSQKQISRPSGKEKVAGPYRKHYHTNRAFDCMNNMRRQNLLCDVILVADGVEIPAHKIVLASCSPYFYAMFSGFEESHQGRVTLQGVDHMALELLIDYVYTTVVDVTEENVQVLLTAANLLQLTDVRDACCDYLQTQLDPSNCLGIRDFADLHGCIELVSYANSYIEQHFVEIVKCDEFFNLTHDQVTKLIKSDRLQVPSEETVFECVVAWIQFNPDRRTDWLAELMECVRLPLLSQDYLVQHVEKEPLLRGDLRCKDLLIEALKYHLLKGEQRASSFNTPRTIPRQPLRLPKVLLVVGGQAPKAIRNVECYDLREECWYQVAEMPTRRCRAGLAVLDDRVYAVGGFNGSLRVRTVDVYDAATDQWATCPSMEARRSTLGVAVLNNCIYAVGGFDGSTGLNSAEMFDPVANQWKFIAPMSTRRSSVGVGVVNGLLYAVGGYDGASRQCLSTVECYNPHTNTWSQVLEMSARRSGAGVGVMNNVLYAVGGHDGPCVRKSVESYDHLSDTWRPVADMALCRRNAGVVALGGLLYVVGGDDGTSNLSSVEVYNPKNDTWTMLSSSMGIGRSYAGVAIIDKPIYANLDESSRAEGASGFSSSSKTNGVHYENIYESIEVNLQNGNTTAEGQYNPTHGPNNTTDRHNCPGPSNSNYDVPRSYRNILVTDRIPNCPLNNTLSLHNRQPPCCSFQTNSNHNTINKKKPADDAEYSNFHRNCQILHLDEKYEHLYDPVRKLCPRTTVYGRLDIIGHGFGRIERHLSSSCGSIDHYSLGNNNPGLKHSQYETTGRICASNSRSNSSQVLSKRNKNNEDPPNGNVSPPPANNSNSNPQPSTSRKSATGAIPKIKTLTLLKKQKRKPDKESHYENYQSNELLINNVNDVNNMSNASNNWVLLNKWLPLWVANSNTHNQYNIMDLNLMFSRQCDCHLMHCPPNNSIVQYSAPTNNSDGIECYEASGDTPYGNDQLPEDDSAKKDTQQSKANNDRSKNSDASVSELPSNSKSSDNPDTNTN